MPRGGARVNSGPPPDPNALRRDRKEDKQGWTLLPAGGREGDPPTWPLADLNAGDSDDAQFAAIRFQERELEVWRDLWATPQAVVWERMKYTHEVAVYTRLVVAAERSADTKALAEARMWSDRLGLNPAAMLRNRWKIAEDELAARRSEPKSAPSARSSSMRDRIRAVNGDA